MDELSKVGDVVILPDYLGEVCPCLYVLVELDK